MKKTISDMKIYEGKAVVCFLDILGFGEFIKSNWNDKINHPLEELLAMKEELKSTEFSNGLILNMKEGEGSNRFHYNCNVKTLSDSLMISIPINDGLTIADVVFSVGSMMNNIMRFWGMALTKGFTIRGGIEYGDIFWDDNELIGPAFIHAYEYESKVADKSRVVCGIRFTNFLIDLNKQADSLGRMMLQNFTIEEGLLCANPNMLYDNPSDRKELLKLVQKLMHDQPKKIHEKYEILENALANPDSVKIPTHNDLMELIQSQMNC